MKSLKVILGTIIIGLSSIVTSNVATAAAHDKGGSAYLSPYFVTKHGKKVPACRQKGYVVVWKNRKPYCVLKKNVKNNFQEQGYRSNGILMWSKHNGKMVARCIKGYKLVKTPGKRPHCERNRGTVNHQNNNKYDKYLLWNKDGVKCSKGKFWHDRQNRVHCSK